MTTIGNRQCGVDPFAPGAVRGIDVSKHQGEVDFEAVAKGNLSLTNKMFNVGGATRVARDLTGKVTFAVARVSDGLSVKDGPVFLNNMKKIRAAGLVPGAYQFLRPDQDPKAQAEYFIQQLDLAGGYQKGDLPPTVDIEVSGGVTPAQVQRAVKIWCETVEAHYGVRPMVYSLSGISNYLGSSLTEYPLWIANFYQKCPKMPSGWTAQDKKWTFFQFDDAGKVQGLPRGRYVDLNVFNGNRQEFDAFIKNSQRREAK